MMRESDISLHYIQLYSLGLKVSSEHNLFAVAAHVGLLLSYDENSWIKYLFILCNAISRKVVL